MSNELKASSSRVQECLSQYGHDFIVQQMPSTTRTAEEAASTIGCMVGQIAKSLVFIHAETGEPVLVIVSGLNRVCVDKVKANTGLTLKKASASFVREKIGFAIGGVPPVAHNNKVNTLLDNDLRQYKEVWAAAGTPNSVFKLNPEHLNELTKGQWIDLSQ
nr:YbaK/EbsC family protein [Thaumasiovibrio subtropicus]